MQWTDEPTVIDDVANESRANETSLAKEMTHKWRNGDGDDATMDFDLFSSREYRVDAGRDDKAPRKISSCEPTSQKELTLKPYSVSHLVLHLYLVGTFWLLHFCPNLALLGS